MVCGNKDQGIFCQSARIIFCNHASKQFISMGNRVKMSPRAVSRCMPCQIDRIKLHKQQLGIMVIKIRQQSFTQPVVITDIPHISTASRRNDFLCNRRPARKCGGLGIGKGILDQTEDRRNSGRRHGMNQSVHLGNRTGQHCCPASGTDRWFGGNGMICDSASCENTVHVRGICLPVECAHTVDTDHQDALKGTKCCFHRLFSPHYCSKRGSPR